MGGAGATDTGGASSGGSSTGGESTGGDNTGGGTSLGGMGGMGDPAAPCDPTSFFCSSFTDPLFEDWSGFDVRNATCVVELVTEPVFTESTSLRSHAPMGCDVSRLNYAFDAEVNSGPLSVRAWFYLPSSVVLDNDLVILELHDATVGSEGKASINLGVGDTVNLEVTTGILPRNSVSSGGIFPRDTWNCAVLRTVVSDASGSVEVELNGVTVHSLTDGDVLPDPGFARAIAGIYNYGMNEVEIYLDDVSVAESALTCP